MLHIFLSNNKSKFLSVLWLIFLLGLMLALTLNPQIYLTACLNGILIWASVVLPSLFPFIFFSKLLMQTGYIDKSAKAFNPLTKKIFGCSGECSNIFLLSIISGYPLGAKLISDAKLNGKISQEDAVHCAAFCNNSGPMFIVGSVATGMFLSARIGYIMLISHILSALINGIIYRNIKIKNEDDFNIVKDKSVENKSIAETMNSSIFAILLVGGFIAIFFVLTTFISSLGILSPIQIMLEKVGIEPNITASIFNGFFEITNGCQALAQSGASLHLKAVIASGIISFGGLAVFAQSMAFLGKIKFPKKLYFLQKTTHAIICMGITSVLCFIFI